MNEAEACFVLAARNYADKTAADEHTILRSAISENSLTKLIIAIINLIFPSLFFLCNKVSCYED